MPEICIERPGRDFVMVPRRVAQSGGALSLRAAGLYCLLASLAPGWRTSIDRLAAHCTEGRHAIMAAKAELEAAGLLRVEQVRVDGSNRFAESRWILTESAAAPQSDFQTTEGPQSEKPQSENQTTGGPWFDFPQSEKPQSENQTAYIDLKKKDQEHKPHAAARCPLAELPTLRAAYPEIVRLLAEAHPRAKAPGPKDAEALAKLARLDGFAEAEIVEALRWLFTAEDERAVFWRQNVHAFAPLRKVRDGASKFARIFEAWKGATARPGTRQAPPPLALDPGLRAALRGGAAR